MGVFNCNKCNKTFTSKSYFKAHQNLHNSYDPIRCPICRSICIRQVDLQLHLKLFHNISSDQSVETKVQCKECGEYILKGAPLRMHMNLHKEMKCKICGKTFTHRQDLKRHKSLKHSVKKCIYCLETFENISEHVQKCLSKNMECEKCKSVFGSFDELEGHLKQSSCGVKRSYQGQIDETSSCSESSEFKGHSLHLNKKKDGDQKDKRFVSKHGNVCDSMSNEMKDGSEMDTNSVSFHGDTMVSQLFVCDALSNKTQKGNDRDIDSASCHGDNEMSQLSECDSLSNKKQNGNEMDIDFGGCHGDIDASKLGQYDSLSNEIQSDKEMSDTSIYSQDQEKISLLQLCGLVLNKKQADAKSDLSECQPDDITHINRKEIENSPSETNVDIFGKYQSHEVERSVINDTSSLTKIHDASSNRQDINIKGNSLEIQDNSLGEDFSTTGNSPKIQAGNSMGEDMRLTESSSKIQAANKLGEDFSIVENSRKIQADNDLHEDFSINENVPLLYNTVQFTQLKSPDSKLRIIPSSPLSRIGKMDDSQKYGIPMYPQVSSPESNKNRTASQQCSIYPLMNNPAAEHLSQECNSSFINEHVINKTWSDNLSKSFDNKEAGHQSLMETDSEFDPVAVEKKMCASLENDNDEVHDGNDPTKISCDISISDVSSFQTESLNLYPGLLGLPLMITNNNVSMATVPCRCVICGEVFMTLNFLYDHYIQKHPKCDICGKQLYSQDGSSKNLTKDRTYPDKRYRCRVCLELYKLSLSVQSKIQPGTLITDKQKCHLCGRSFKSLKSFDLHSRIHTQFKPHKCHLCGKKFMWKNSLSQHYNLHNGAKPYKCAICERLFSGQRGIELHVRHTHNTNQSALYQCEICGQKFCKLYNLEKHLLKHTKLKEHECCKCGKKFMSCFNLKSHIVKTHNDIPYLLQKNIEEAKQNTKNNSGIHTSGRSEDKKCQGQMSFIEGQRSLGEVQMSPGEAQSTLDQGLYNFRLANGCSKGQSSSDIQGQNQENDKGQQVQERYKGQSSSVDVDEMDQDQSLTDNNQDTSEHSEKESTRIQSSHDNQNRENFQRNLDQNCDRLDETDGNICQVQGHVDLMDQEEVINQRSRLNIFPESSNDHEKVKCQKKQNITEEKKVEHQEQAQTQWPKPRNYKKKTNYVTICVDDKIMRVKYHSDSFTVCKMPDELKDREKWLHGEVLKTCMDLVNNDDIDQSDTVFREDWRREEGEIIKKKPSIYSSEFNYYESCDFEKSMKKEKRLTEGDQHQETCIENKLKNKDRKKKIMNIKRNEDVKFCSRLNSKERDIDSRIEDPKHTTDPYDGVKNYTHMQVTTFNKNNSNSGCHGNCTEIRDNGSRVDTGSDITMNKNNSNIGCHGNSKEIDMRFDACNDITTFNKRNVKSGCHGNMLTKKGNTSNHATSCSSDYNTLQDSDRSEMRNLFTSLRKNRYQLLATLAPGGDSNFDNQKHITDTRDNSNKSANYGEITEMEEDSASCNNYIDKSKTDSVNGDNLNQAHVTGEDRPSIKQHKDVTLSFEDGASSEHQEVVATLGENRPNIAQCKDVTPFGVGGASSEHQKVVATLRENRSSIEQNKEAMQLTKNRENSEHHKDAMREDRASSEQEKYVTFLLEDSAISEHQKNTMVLMEVGANSKHEKDVTLLGEDSQSSEHHQKTPMQLNKNTISSENGVITLREDSTCNDYHKNEIPIARTDTVWRNNNNKNPTAIRDGISKNDKSKQVTGIKGDNSGSDCDKLSPTKRADTKDKTEITSRDFPPRTMSKTEGSKDYLQSNFILHNIGRLYPRHTASDLFHTRDYIYPVGYRASRSFWSMRQLDKSCRYICSITDKDGHPLFVIEAIETGLRNVIFRGSSIRNVFNHVKEMVDMRRGCYSDRSTGRAFPDISSGEEFFGLSIPVICKALEDLPGSEQLVYYRHKYKHLVTTELPVVVYPHGCARTEVNKAESQVKKHCKLKSRNLSYSSHQFSPSSHQFSSPSPEHSLRSSPLKSKKTQSTCPGFRDRNYRYLYNLFKRQYLELRHGWKNTTYVGRSHIQGLGLFAAKDIDKDTLVLEYVGELIRNSVADSREKKYKSENRGVYMFRLNEDQVIDATRLGGPARYINHSCNPNCTAEIFELETRSRIIILTNSYVRKGEELTYDYRFDIEEDEHKLPCLCGSSHCRKFMN